MSEKKTSPPPQKPVKSRNWSFIAYPESLNPDWRETLRGFGLKGFISPLHDKDINEDGTPKKAHYHITIIYGNTTTANSIYTSVCEPLGPGATHPIKCNSIEGSFDYASHECCPDKAQYSVEDIECLNGFDICNFRRRERSDDKSDMVAIHTLIRDYWLYEYHLLIDYLLGNDMADLAMFVFNHASAFNYYCRSLRYSDYVKGNQSDE